MRSVADYAVSVGVERARRICRRGGVAQMVERSLSVRQVGGSMPSASIRFASVVRVSFSAVVECRASFSFCPCAAECRAHLSFCSATVECRAHLPFGVLWFCAAHPSLFVLVQQNAFIRFASLLSRHLSFSFCSAAVHSAAFPAACHPETDPGHDPTDTRSPPPLACNL